jgi:hypothetical protein
MAAPTVKTGDELCTEAFKKCGIDSPTATQLTRAEDNFLNEIKNDIWLRAGRSGNTRLKSLQAVAVDITIDGQSRYAWPTDFAEEITLSWLTGSHTGTATAGAASTITLAADEDATEDEVVGKYILLTGGTGENGFRQVVAYDTDTYIATVDAAWDTNPSTDSTYRIIDSVTKLDEDNLLDYGLGGDITEGQPSCFTKVNEGVNEYYILDKNPDAGTYGLHLRYYANLMEIDVVEGSTIMSKLFLNWWDVLVNGLAWKIALDEDDSKYKIFKGEYERLVTDLLAKEEAPYGGEFQGFEL